MLLNFHNNGSFFLNRNRKFVTPVSYLCVTFRLFYSKKTLNCLSTRFSENSINRNSSYFAVEAKQLSHVPIDRPTLACQYFVGNFEYEP